MKAKIEHIKAKQEKIAMLLDLYRKTIENENKAYHLFEDRETRENYYLLNREANEVICYGNKDRIVSYMRIRKIEMEKVFIDATDFGG